MLSNIRTTLKARKVDYNDPWLESDKKKKKKLVFKERGG